MLYPPYIGVFLLSAEGVDFEQSREREKDALVCCEEKKVSVPLGDGSPLSVSMHVYVHLRWLVLCFWFVHPPVLPLMYAPRPRPPAPLPNADRYVSSSTELVGFILNCW